MLKNKRIESIGDRKGIKFVTHEEIDGILKSWTSKQKKNADWFDDDTLPSLFRCEKRGYVCGNWDAEADLKKLIESDEDVAYHELMRGAIENTLKKRAPHKPLDVGDLCDHLILPLLGSDYKFVGKASYLIPTFSTDYGHGLHLNFFARRPSVPDSDPVLFFAEVAFGDPQKAIRCVPLHHISYQPGDEYKGSTIVHHPVNEDCVYCENANQNPFNENNYFLAPPLMKK